MTAGYPIRAAPVLYWQEGPRGQTSENGLNTEADARIRTADPFITSEVLYQLSYVGKGSSVYPEA